MLARLGAVTALVAALLVPTGAQPAHATGATPSQAVHTLFNLMNHSRAASGKTELLHAAPLHRVAQDWADKMASGAVAYGHNPDFFDQIPGNWVQAAENVAYRSVDDPVALHNQWVSSSSHNTNMLKAWTHAGIGYACASAAPYYCYGVQAYGYFVNQLELIETPAPPPYTDVAVTAEVAPEAPRGSLQWIHATVTNNSGAHTATGVRLEIRYPDSFVVSNPVLPPGATPSAGKVVWQIGSLEPGAQTSISIPYTVASWTAVGRTAWVIFETTSTSDDPDTRNNHLSLAQIAAPGGSGAVLPLVTGTVEITGTTKVGQTLTVLTDGWTDGTSFNIRWLRDGKTISGATKRTYKLTSSDHGKRISVKATGSIPGRSASRTSAKTAKVATGTLAKQTVTITGTLAVGKTLTASSASWPDKPTLKYQWYLGGKAVKGATKKTYKLPASAVGKTVRVKVTATKKKYSTVTQNIYGAQTIVKGTFAGVQARISGTAQTGKTLTAIVGTRSPKATSNSYQWYRDGIAIPKATKKTYKVPANAMGATFTVRITSKRSGYNNYVTMSEPTAPALGTLQKSTPKITGTARTGKTLTAVAGTWTDGAELTYQWYRASSSTGKLYTIAGATDPTYVVAAGDKGRVIAVKVTGSLAGYATASVTSKRTGKVK